MSPPLDRRTVLSSLGCLAVAGCLGTGDSGTDTSVASDEETTDTTPGPSSPVDRPPSDEETTAWETGTPPGTAGLPTRLWLERVDVPADERGSVDPIAFADLSESERDVVRTALEAGEYTADSDLYTPGLESLRDRIEARADGGLVVYLRRGETYYRVGFAAGDFIVASPDA